MGNSKRGVGERGAWLTLASFLLQPTRPTRRRIRTRPADRHCASAGVVSINRSPDQLLKNLVT
jgi:hypothetical protein